MPRSLATCLVLGPLALGCSNQTELRSPVRRTLEDALLITTTLGVDGYDVFRLGDVRMGRGPVFFDQTVPEIWVGWWLHGIIDGQPAYTSNRNLRGSAIGEEPPYAPLEKGEEPRDWSVVENLQAFAEEGDYDEDWWERVLAEHNFHISSDTEEADLWRFGPDGAVELGTVWIDLDVEPSLDEDE